ncbi:hypothetical protein F5B22DRAFT_608496 [Xylaria bambusicola]|uniref:uncharacterized protein n=1 Tax=Xylaria bambusicola TaxID=326684 RepID=UPI0020089E1C|nr:uncharacterized protein F5B22DRAFT_608496 [Xylaria bambusicola]KAI0515132.1 hypothetical protein F5B22DRAFT_608496 [Xylaria bambusicola]
MSVNSKYLPVAFQRDMFVAVFIGLLWMAHYSTRDRSCKWHVSSMASMLGILTVKAYWLLVKVCWLRKLF